MIPAVDTYQDHSFHPDLELMYSYLPSPEPPPFVFTLRLVYVVGLDLPPKVPRGASEEGDVHTAEHVVDRGDQHRIPGEEDGNKGGGGRKGGHAEME